jgi:flagellar biosynthesis/type III secretory pathway chaperone
MNDHFEELAHVLEKELEFHGLLFAAASGMNRALRNRALEEIRKTSRQYDECTCRIEELEEKRLQLSDLICQDDKQRAPHVNLLSVIERAPATHKNRIAELRLSLKNTIGDLSRVNYSNQVFLQESLRTIAKTFEILTIHETAKLNGYKAHGEKDRSRTSKIIVNTIA